MMDFDAIIIGAGQAGPSLAGRLTTAGMKVALIERKFIGGTCVNAGCMPTKTLVASARAAHVARNAAAFGVNVDQPVGIDMAKVKSRADTVIGNARGNLEAWLGKMADLTLVRGTARFDGPNAVAVGGKRLSAPRIFINVGGRPVIPRLPGIDEVAHLTSTSILELDSVPRHLVIVGGSYIGLEFAQMYRRFGAEVTIVERNPRLISREDEDISDAIADILGREGIGIRTGADCIAFSRHSEGIAVSVDCTAGPPEIIGSHVLVAVGRRPNTDDLGLEAVGVETDERGYIKVNDRLETTASGIWAMGDCNGWGGFTHTAYNDFEIVAANLLDNGDRKVSARVAAYALYIDPPLGRAGMSEREARASGRPLLVSKRPMARVGRAVEKGETQGFMKAIADAETKQILGAAILGIEGDEAIHGIVDTMSSGSPYTVLQWAVPIHPTVSELIPTLLGDLKPA
ncbi:FAD-containing oxidoreductase [Rhizobiaceae bacterium n13]|uniref:FAD-containing oxidoreductase n=1 Tax=Ferirhizobium litorale TaxID=2927786 RepID=A0AAE3QDD1_9HYPH|nr:FAD-containing oxidoreductase [Fererhizobium litorale]MDI7863170.1 FAD-containing oxidoreductase [Fererhizobium litorale]MDI7923095.1 FAD-containing oxidoreductase [Fererhizobium litorale]